MATPSAPVPHLNLKLDLPPSSNLKQEPQIAPQSSSSSSDQPKFLKSIEDLASLSAAIDAFRCRFQELQNHLNFIRDAIDSKSNLNGGHQPDLSLSPAAAVAAADAKSNDVRYLCETMCGRGLRKFMASHLSHPSKLREQVPPALKLAPKPAKLVSECIGRFYLQGSKAYTKDSHMITGRQAAVLSLECFLLTLHDYEPESEASLKSEMEQGAIGWRKRLISEGGLGKASTLDARGLLLFIACFGIPAVFKAEEIGHLLRLCEMREISNALKGSRVLLAKMPEIIESMVKNGMHIEAVDVVNCFCIEDKFPPQEILTTVLRESKEAHKKARQDAKSSPLALKEANERQLVVLKSVIKYVEDHCWDLTKFFGGWQIKEKIVKLEKESADLDKQIGDKGGITKRKLDEVGSSSKAKTQETKRSRFGVKGQHLLTSHANGFREQRVATLVNGLRSYETVVPNSFSAGVSGHIYSHPSVQAGAGRSLMGGKGLLSSPYAGVHAEIGVDEVSALMGKSRPQYGWHGSDTAIIDRPVGQSSGEHPSSVNATGLYGPPPGFGPPDYPSRSASNRASASELYRFVDVMENETFGTGSNRPGASTTSVPAIYHPSYMY